MPQPTQLASKEESRIANRVAALEYWQRCTLAWSGAIFEFGLWEVTEGLRIHYGEASRGCDTSKEVEEA